MDESRLPTGIWIDAHLRRLEQKAIPYYILNKGAYAGGTVLLKLNGRDKGCAALIQQRDVHGVLGWANALGKENAGEPEIDEYISRAVSRDPDLWVVEIEDREMKNPFEEK